MAVGARATGGSFLRSVRGGGARAQNNGPEPLPPRWLELLAKLNTEVGPWVMAQADTIATADIPPIEHDGMGLALLQFAKLFQRTDEPPGRRWKMLLQRLLRMVIHREARSDKPLRQSWPANDNASTTRPPNAPGNRPSHCGPMN